MNTLPDTSGKSTIPSPIPTPTSSGLSKEMEGITFSDTESQLRDTTKEMELPKEVEAIGVKTQPTVVPIPPPMQSMGIKPLGTNIPTIQSKRTVPLSDAQIAQGLHMSIIHSFRWLAEWCKRQLKQIGITK